MVEQGPSKLPAAPPQAVVTTPSGPVEVMPLSLLFEESETSRAPGELGSGSTATGWL